MSLAKPLPQVSKDDLLELCEDRAPESKRLEFKSVLPDRNDKGRFELAKDVAAFANAEGGDLIFGIEETDGSACSVNWISDEGFDPAVRRIGQVLDSGVEPKIYGVQFHQVESSDGFALMVRVPASLDGPHRVTVNSASRFVIRESAYVRDMTFSEIQSAFNRPITLRDFSEQARSQAISEIKTKTTWRPIYDGPVTLVQVIPSVATMRSVNLDIHAVYANLTDFFCYQWGGGSRAYNLDGVVFYAGGSEELIYGYNLIYRNGRMDSLSFAGRFSSDEHMLPSYGVAEHIKDVTGCFIKGLKTAGIGGSAVVLVTLVGVKDWTLGMGPGFYFRTNPVSDRDVLALPEIVIENIDEASDSAAIVRPLLDMMWQSFGIASCNYYDESGQWVNH